MNSSFKAVFNLIPPQYRSSAVIAGGAAACLEKADDIDVWVLGLDDGIKVTKFKQALGHLKAHGKWTEIDFVDNAEQTAKQCDSGENWNNQIIANIKDGITLPNDDPFALDECTKPVQIMASVFHTPQDLLNDFDLSVHCVAVMPNGTEVRLTNRTTSLTEPPKVVGQPKTLSRYRRFCLRYGLQPDPAELVKLCNMPDPTPASDV